MKPLTLETFMTEIADKFSPDIRSRLVFQRLELNRLGGPSLEVQLSGLPTNCYLGVDVGGRAWIRIECDPASVSRFDQAAAVSFETSADGYLVTVNPEVNDFVIAHLFEEIAQLVSDGHPAADAGFVALQGWQELLARPVGAPLSETALVGLMGELEVLELVVSAGGGIEHWTGWIKDHCDFRLPGLTIEVKSTLSASYRRVQVHGLRQLADPEDGSELVLVLRRFERSADGRSVPDAIDDLVKLGVSRSTLLNSLADVGYSEVHRMDYDSLRFVSDEEALRQIDDSHPRLIPEMLAEVDLSCIDSIDYELNLNGTAEADLNTTLANLIESVLG
jgi:hypothetical protein